MINGVEMEMTRNSTQQATTATLSPMLIVPFVCCSDPVDSLAFRAKMKAGMMQMRKRRYAPQQIIVKAENTRAQIAKLSLASAGEDASVVVAVVG